MVVKILADGKRDATGWEAFIREWGVLKYLQVSGAEPIFEATYLRDCTSVRPSFLAKEDNRGWLSFVLAKKVNCPKTTSQ